MDFNIAAFGWHATIFIGWGTLAVVVAGILAVAVMVKRLVASAG